MGTYYATVEIEIEAENTGEIPAIIRDALKMNVAVDTIKDYSSDHFEGKMDMYREYGVKTY